MKKKFVELFGWKRVSYKTRSGYESSMLTWYFIDYWLVTKESDTSRYIDFKQLIKKISRNGSTPS